MPTIYEIRKTENGPQEDSLRGDISLRGFLQIREQLTIRLSCREHQIFPETIPRVPALHVTQIRIFLTIQNMHCFHVPVTFFADVTLHAKKPFVLGSIFYVVTEMAIKFPG